LPSEFVTPVLFVTRIVTVALFIFLAIEPPEKLIDLFRLGIQSAFVVILDLRCKRLREKHNERYHNRNQYPLEYP
jgi:hypothetical protein